MPPADAGTLTHPSAMARVQPQATGRLPRRLTWTLAAGVSLGLWALIGFGISAVTSSLHG